MPSSFRNAPEDDRKLADLCFGFYDRMVIFDHISKTILVVLTCRIVGSEGNPHGKLRRRLPAQSIGSWNGFSKEWPIPADRHRAGRRRRRWPFTSNFTEQGV